MFKKASRPTQNKKKLLLHLGANKTGSSYIQEFVAKNHQAWRGDGLLCPSNDFAKADEIEGYHVWSLQQILNEPKAGAAELERKIRALFDKNDEVERVFLSAENLLSHPDAPGVFKKISEDFDVFALMYIRRQDDYILSSWQQWNSKIRSDFWAWAINNIGVLGDWQADIQRWLEVIPKSRLRVQVFEKQAFKGGSLLADFYSWLNCTPPLDALALPTQRDNKALSIAITDLVCGNEEIFSDAHDPRFYEMVKDLTGTRFLKQRRECALTLQQRRSMVRKYFDGNLWIRDNFFPQRPKSLFTLPTEDTTEYMDTEARRAMQLSFLSTALYRLYLRQQGG